MSPEKLPSNIFEEISVLADLTGEPVLITSKMPREEFYTDEICRLTDAALDSSPVQVVGWVDSMATVVNFREKIYRRGGLTYQVGEYRDATLEPNIPPLLVRFILIQPQTHNIHRQKVRPTELQYYYPASNELKIVRLDDLNTNDMVDINKLQEIVDLDAKINPLKPDKKERFFFYSGLVDAAGEKLPK